ncbi:tripartite tricarboxylate transporter TctB [Paeniglutamicibacter psychrophenolicus]|uniref:Tricarboxylic transport membrane protein n=1 Tax=Paeniglutamicibacter psychrophenolicus TaxID=257454 RepID=A0ABS4WA74_9MICC|nr:tripartite tricarboxylate transporter TctB family protein [Paeniglutamicibacter psychrophenolicus]MBP2373107.1 putative tricarboxylic transport membrane protein [Paeniglutamicibacter psychrophenolicus]
MSTDTATESIDRTPPATSSAGGFLAGRSSLVVAGILLAMGLYLTFGIITMDVPQGAKTPGPRFFPILITVAIFLLASVLVLQSFRQPEPAPAAAGNFRFYSDWKAVSLVFFAFLAFAFLLVPVGWLLSAALLFWAVARALGSKRPVFDIGVALVFSAFIQLAFGAGLGLTLPGGILEGIYG